MSQSTGLYKQLTERRQCMLGKDLEEVMLHVLVKISSFRQSSQQSAFQETGQKNSFESKRLIRPANAEMSVYRFLI